jgi:hypothetical protein
MGKQRLKFFFQRNSGAFSDLVEPLNANGQNPLQPREEEDSQQYGSADAILEVLYLVRETITELIASTGADPAKTRDTARRLNLSNNLVWPVSRFINAEDIVTAGSEVMDRVKFEKICDACEAKGAPLNLVVQARRAIDMFEELITVSAGDRQSFSLLLTGLGFQDVTQRQESTRKMAFLSNSSLWGVQCRLSFKTVIFAPNAEDPDEVDAIRVFGMVDFRRLRPVPWPLYRMHGYGDDGSIRPGTGIPIEPPPEGAGPVPLLRDYCSQPLPDLRAVKRDYGQRFDLCEGPIGNAGLLTCVIADRLVKWQSVYRVPEKDEFMGALFDLVTPLEHMLFDVFVHQDLPLTGPPESTLLDRLTAPRGFDPENDPYRQLPLSNKVLRLGPGLLGNASAHYPQYAPLMDHVFRKSELDPREFQGYRLSIRYPQIPTAADLQWRLPERTP